MIKVTQSSKDSPKVKKGRGGKRGCFAWLVILLFVIVLVGGGIGYLSFEIYTSPYKKMADQFDLEKVNNVDKPSIIYDRSGEEIGRIYEENRSYVTLDKISPAMVSALIAQEDARFRTHPGYDLVGMGRAAKGLLQAGGDVKQGASTITQQLARNAYDLPAKCAARGYGGFDRKIVEIYLAMRITERYSKNQVLEFYLNRIYFGSGFYGVRAAALGYFGKEPSDLTTRESATMAGLIKSPEALTPLRNPKDSLFWRNHVLDRMSSEGYITVEEATKIKSMPLGLNPKPLNRGVSHIYDRISTQIKQYLGEAQVNASGLKIYTTLDKRMQEESGRALKAAIERAEKDAHFKHPKLAEVRRAKKDGLPPSYLDGALLVIDNVTGAILAYHGGRDYLMRQYDAIEEGARPSGTAILPFLYAAAFDNGFSPVTHLLDDALDNRLVGIGGAEGILGEWGQEATNIFYDGNISVREALGKSKVSASLRLGMDLGTTPFIKELESFGIRKPVRESGTEVAPVYRPRIFVGTESVSLKEMVMAYSAIPNAGKRAEALYVIDRIVDENGLTIWESPQATGAYRKKTATSDSTAYQVHSILHDSLNDGAGKAAAQHLPQGFKGGVKAGSTYNFSDCWMFGYDSNITCGLWVGFLEGNKSIYQAALASDVCGSVLGACMRESVRLSAPRELLPPSSLECVPICKKSGKRATNLCYELVQEDGTGYYVRVSVNEYLRKGDGSLAFCDLHNEEVNLDLFQPDGSLGVGTRILPVVPILPQDPILLAKQDPYKSSVSLNPTYKQRENVIDENGNAPAVAEMAEDEGAEENVNFETKISLPTPDRLSIPPLPLNTDQ